MTAAEKRLKVRENRKNGNIKKLSIGDVASGVLNGIGTASDYVDKSVGIAGTPVNVYNARKGLKNLALNATGQKDNKWADLGLEFLIPDSSDLLGGAGYATRGADLLQALRIAKKTPKSSIKIAKAGIKDIVDGPPKPPTAFAGLSIGQHFKNGGKKLVDNGKENGEKIVNGSLNKMTVDEAGDVYGKFRNKEIGAELTGTQRSADPDVMKIGRYIKENRVDELTPRHRNAIASTAKRSDPVEYSAKYYESRGLKAEAHHVLDHGFWGKALDSPNGQIAGEALWTKGVKSGNDSTNLVSSWSTKTKGYDHETLHRLYKTIDKRNLVNEMMDKGIWHKQPPEKQAKILREVADRQYRLTANFYRLKLSAIKRNNPKLLKLSPKQLKEELFKNPQKYAEINPIEGFDYKNPQHVKEFQAQLNAIPNSGKVTKEMKVVFGLVIPKGGAKTWQGTANQKRFDLTIGPLTKRITRDKNKLAINK
tara:strand:+ start:73 stop:1509 length:1437 start_codon:yes stop_codon:yes gene_type:complete